MSLPPPLRKSQPAGRHAVGSSRRSRPPRVGRGSPARLARYSFRAWPEERTPLAQPGQPLYGLEASNRGRVILFGGGVPLQVDGVVVGAVGVSGGSVPQDQEVALAGATAFEDLVREPQPTSAR